MTAAVHARRLGGVKKYALLISIAIVATGCATMINGKVQTVSGDSFPAGASITVDCGYAGSVAVAGLSSGLRRMSRNSRPIPTQIAESATLKAGQWWSRT